MLPAGRVYAPAVRIDFTRSQDYHSQAEPVATRAIYLTSNPSLDTGTSTTWSTDVDPPDARTSPLTEKCDRFCPTVTYLMINFVWMSTGTAGIALGNLLHPRYFSLLFISVTALMAAVVYRFFYNLEHMEPTEFPEPSYTSSSTHSHRSLPPTYSTIVRAETPPPSYQESLATVHKAAPFRLPTTNAPIRAK